MFFLHTNTHTCAYLSVAVSTSVLSSVYQSVAELCPSFCAYYVAGSVCECICICFWLCLHQSDYVCICLSIAVLSLPLSLNIRSKTYPLLTKKENVFFKVTNSKPIFGLSFELTRKTIFFLQLKIKTPRKMSVKFFKQLFRIPKLKTRNFHFHGRKYT